MHYEEKSNEQHYMEAFDALYGILNEILNFNQRLSSICKASSIGYTIQRSV